MRHLARKFITVARFIGLFLSGMIAPIAIADSPPSVAQIQQDIRQFQQFFLARFADLPLSAYNDGVNGLPQYAQRRLNWQLLMEFPPFESAMQRGNARWQAPLPSARSLADCFVGNPPPSAYPYFFAGKVHTIVGDINACLITNGAEALDGASGDMARLVAAYKAPWSGERIDIDYRSEQMRQLYQQGRQYFWAKRGQMNLSCANCHVHNAGNQLRGDILSAALGQTSGFPVYSTAWWLQGEPMGTVHRRYQACNALAQAAPLPAQSKPYIALEIYQGIMNSGIPIKTPGYRQ